MRPNNEDSYLVARADRSLEMLLTNLPPGEVPGWAAERCYGLAVADGMGGEAAGEVASQVALRAVIENVLATADWIMRDIEAHSAQIEERLAERFAAAGEAVKEEARTHPRWFGMGTTMTMAVSSGAILFVGHIGDSRAYLLRGGQLQSLTRDHSFAQALAETGVISPFEVARHRMRNVLLRFVGGQSSNADLRHLPLLSGDQLLLCTDGLTDMVAAPAISQMMQAPRRRSSCLRRTRGGGPGSGRERQRHCPAGSLCLVAAGAGVGGRESKVEGRRTKVEGRRSEVGGRG